MLRRLARHSLPALTLACLTALPLSLTGPARAQLLYDDFLAEGEAVVIRGPWARYQTHVLQLRKNRYAVLFRPGFVHAPTALDAISPLCAARDMQAVLTETIAPVALVLENGGDMVHQGFQIDCVAKE